MTPDDLTAIKACIELHRLPEHLFLDENDIGIVFHFDFGGNNHLDSWARLSVADMWVREYAAYLKASLAEGGWSTIVRKIYAEGGSYRMLYIINHGKYRSTQDHRFDPSDPTGESMAIIRAAVEINLS